MCKSKVTFDSKDGNDGNGTSETTIRSYGKWVTSIQSGFEMPWLIFKYEFFSEYFIIKLDGISYLICFNLMFVKLIFSDKNKIWAPPKLSESQ